MGRIIMCYAGVGKTTLAEKDKNYIDLDSCFFEDMASYALAALYLAGFGFDVLVSAHKGLYNSLAWYKVKNHDTVELITVYPSIVLREAWCKKLMDRYLANNTDADKAALLRAIECYEADVEDMKQRKGKKIEIGDIIEYNLGELLSPAPKEDCFSKVFRRQTNGCEPVKGDYVYVAGMKWVYDGKEWTC